MRVILVLVLGRLGMCMSSERIVGLFGGLDRNAFEEHPLYLHMSAS